MKILLIQPPVQDFYETSIRIQPLGLAYLAASLQTEGHRVEILDCREGKKRSIPIPPELSYLRDLYPFDDRSPFKLYGGYYHFGMGWSEIDGRLQQSDAEVFGISSSFTPYHREAEQIAGMIKTRDHGKIVIMGGAHVSCAPESVLENPCVDYLVLGEGEFRLPRLIRQIEKGRLNGLDEMDGIGYRRNGDLRINPVETFIEDLDAIPDPARDLLDPNRYRIRGLPSTMMLTSRGCPHRCAYCSAHRVMGEAFRKRSPERIILEMAECQRKYGTRVFDIEDDNFTFDRQRAKRLMGLIIETFGERRLRLTAMNGISYASLDGELLDLMGRAGFESLNLSLVSADSSVKERMGRPTCDRTFDDILDHVERAGLRAVTYAILGIPGQTIADMIDTVIYLMGRRALIGPSIYYPTPGTPLFLRCRKENILPSCHAQWRSSAFPIETEDFNRTDLVTLFRLTRAINFIKGKIDKNQLAEGITWGELQLFTQEPRRAEEDWCALLSLLFKEKTFFGVRRVIGEKRSVFFKERSSKRLLDYFFERAWNQPILGTR